MVVLRFVISSAAALLLLSSCGKDAAPATASAMPDPGTQQVKRIKSGDLMDDDSGRLLSRYGSTNPALARQGGSTAGESGQTNSQYDREIATREFATKDYSKKSFWGDKDYAKKVYKGDLDGSRFHQPAQLGQTGARENTMMARDSGRGFNAPAYQTGAAREQGGKRIERTSDSETDVRRKVYKQPEITGWREHRALTVEDTKRMLGR